MVGKSVWKINEKTDWKKYKELMQNKIQNYDWNTKNSTEYTEKYYSMKQPPKAQENIKSQITFSIINRFKKQKS